MKMNYKIWIGTILLVLVVVSVGLISLSIDYFQKQKANDNSMNSYMYTVRVTTDAILSNVTLYVPLPVENNTSSISQDIIHDFNDDDDSWDYTLLETEHGLMFLMHTKKIEPKYVVNSGKTPEKRLIYSSSNTMIVRPNETIDTIDPIENDLVLMPKYNTVNLGAITSERNAISYKYDSRIYAYYETSADANVSIDVILEGMNEWWSGSNYYRDEINAKLLGSQDEWVNANGKLVTGHGTYSED